VLVAFYGLLFRIYLSLRQRKISVTTGIAQSIEIVTKADYRHLATELTLCHVETPSLTVA